MLTNRNSSKCKIIKLCNRLLNEDTNISDIFYELYSLLDDFYINEDLKNFCSLIIDETDWIPQKEKQKRVLARIKLDLELLTLPP